MARRLDLADRGVQGSKEHVLFQDLFFLGPVASEALQQGIHEGGFAGVGIAHQGDPGHAGLKAAASLGLSFPVYHPELLFHLADPVLDPAAVQLQLLFAGALVGKAAAAAALPGELGVHARQTGQDIFEPCGLHLQGGLPGPGPSGKDLQDDAGLVQDLGVQLLFQVADLEGGEGFVEDDHVGVAESDLVLQFSHLAAAHVGAVGDLRRVLDHNRDYLQIAGLGQALQLLHGPCVFVGGKLGIYPGQDGPGLFPRVFQISDICHRIPFY